MDAEAHPESNFGGRASLTGAMASTSANRLLLLEEAGKTAMFEC